MEIPKYHSQSKMLWNHLIFNMLGMFYLWARHVFCWGKEILYSSVISQVPFFTHFFPWLCLSLIIQKKCTPIECKHCCILLHFFFHQDATSSSISVSGRTHIYTPLFYETLRMLPWPFFVPLCSFAPIGNLMYIIVVGFSSIFLQILFQREMLEELFTCEELREFDGPKDTVIQIKFYQYFLRNRGRRLKLTSLA